MSVFEHLLVVPSVIYGLVITRLLQGLGEFVHPRVQVRPDGVYLLFVAYVFLVTVQEWWRSYDELIRRYDQVRQAVYFHDYLAVAVVPGLLYLAAAMLVPDETAGEAFDLSAHYGNVQKWFFGVLAAFHLVTIADDVLLLRGALLTPSNLLLAAGAGACLVLAVVERRWVHAVIGPAMLGGQGVHIVLFSLRIGL